MPSISQYVDVEFDWDDVIRATTRDGDLRLIVDALVKAGHADLVNVRTTQ